MKNDGGAAFPFAMHDGDKIQFQYGMTMRQFYKQGALDGILGNPDTFRFKNDADIASMAGSLADAMIAEDMLAAREGKNE